MSEREKNLELAKKIYKEITDIIDKWESFPRKDISISWNETVTIDKDKFTFFDLFEEK